MSAAIRKAIALIVGACVGLHPIPARAEASYAINTVGDLRARCEGVTGTPKTNDQLSENLICISYIAGATDALAQSAALQPLPKKSDYCAPSSVTMEDIAAAFMKWADDHPTSKQMSPASGVISALNNAWPCAAK